MRFNLCSSAVLLVLAGSMLSACSGGSSEGGGGNPTVGGSVSGLLAGASVELQDGGGGTATVSANGTYTFATSLPAGTNYAVTVAVQPAGETCAVTNGVGTIGGASTTNVLVNCVPNPYAISGTLSGLLAGRSLVLQDNGADSLTLSADGAFKFAALVLSGSDFAVRVLSQPAGQNCSVGNGSGIVAAADVVDVTVACSANTFNIAVTVSGLSAGTQLALQNNGADTLTVAADGSFNFDTPVPSGSAYRITVSSQPLGETCTVSNGSGTVVNANIGNVAVACLPNPYSVGGTLSGLQSGKSLILQNNGSDSKTLMVNGSFTFNSPVLSGSTYSVTVLSQPSGQNCTVTNGGGTVSGAPVSSISVTCSDNSYNVGVAVSGLIRAGLVLQDNGSDSLPIPANGSYDFNTPVASGSPYAVTIQSQPPGEACAVTGGSGTIVNANVTGIPVVCTAKRYKLGGAVTGLLPGNSVVLQNNGVNPTYTLSANGSFTLPGSLASGSSYAVAVLTQPAGQLCSVSNGAGTIVGADVSSIGVACSDNTYNVIAAVTGLSAAGLVLQDNGGDNLPIAVDGSYDFATPIPSGSPYLVTILSLPLGENCAPASAGGTVGSANVTIDINCTPKPYTIGGTVSGLLTGNSVVLQDNGGDNKTIPGNSSFTFSTPVLSGSSYVVTVLSAPAGQSCQVGNGSGTVAGAVVDTVTVACSTNSYNIGVTVSGLTVSGVIGTGLVLEDNGGDNLPITGNGGHVFPTAVPSGGGYSVSVLSQPLGETCMVSNGSGTVVGSDVTGIPVSCVPNLYTIGVAVSGVLRPGLILQDNDGDNLPVPADGSYTFATSLQSGAPYVVTVQASPPGETCTVSGGSGAIGSANVTGIPVVCTPLLYPVGGMVAGLLPGNGVTLQDNGTDDLPVAANGSFEFATSVASGSSYAVTVSAQPPGQNCTVTAGSGMIVAAPITNVGVSCSDETYNVVVSVSGLVTGDTLVLQNNGGDNLSLTMNGTMNFPTPVPNGSTYSITIFTPATGENCVLTNASGSVNGANVAVGVSCTPLLYTIGGSVSGLMMPGASVDLQDNGGDDQTVMAPGNSFTFPTPIPYGGTYAVTVASTAPPGLTCIVLANGSGTVGAGNVTNVMVACGP